MLSQQEHDLAEGPGPCEFGVARMANDLLGALAHLRQVCQDCLHLLLELHEQDTRRPGGKARPLNGSVHPDALAGFQRCTVDRTFHPDPSAGLERHSAAHVTLDHHIAFEAVGLSAFHEWAAQLCHRDDGDPADVGLDGEQHRAPRCGGHYLGAGGVELCARSCTQADLRCRGWLQEPTRHIVPGSPFFVRDQASQYLTRFDLNTV